MFGDHFPLFSILRGVKPESVCQVAEVLLNANITLIEVPLTTSNALESISRLVKEFGEKIVTGAGTVTNPSQVQDVHNAGGKLIVSPHFDPEIFQEACKLELFVIPGVMTPTEIIVAWQAGARNLKLFPAGTLGGDYIKSIQAVLPADLKLIAVGGVSADNMSEFWEAGARGFGIGKELFDSKAGLDLIDQRAKTFVGLIKKLAASRPA